MADWILVPCLVSLRSEFNALAPGRDKSSDGSIGDAAHAGSSSDHNPDETGSTPYEDADNINEVHAIDVDSDLRKSGWTMQRCVDIVVGRHRSGADDRLQNVIYNRRIASRSWGWTWRDYTGSSPHTEHAHFSSRYTTAQESSTRPWGLLSEEDDDMPTASEVAAEVIKQLKAQSGKDAIYYGWNQDRIREYDTDSKTLVQVPRPVTSADNGYMTPASALTYAVKNGDWAKAMLTLVNGKSDAMLGLARAMAATLDTSVSADSAAHVELKRQLQEAIEEAREIPELTIDGVLAGLGTGQSAEQAAEMLRQIYGADLASQIGDLLVAKASPA
jgi:hypothetical protein